MSPDITNASLFASNTRLPALTAASVGNCVVTLDIVGLAAVTVQYLAWPYHAAAAVLAGCYAAWPTDAPLTH